MDRLLLLHLTSILRSGRSLRAGVLSDPGLGSAKHEGTLSIGLPPWLRGRPAPSSRPGTPRSAGDWQLASAGDAHGAERSTGDRRAGGVTARCGSAGGSAAISVAAAGGSNPLVRCRLRAKTANAVPLVWMLVPLVGSMARRWNPPTSDRGVGGRMAPNLPHGDACPEERGEELPRLSKPVPASGLGEDVPRRSRCARPLPLMGEKSVRCRLPVELANDPL